MKTCRFSKIAARSSVHWQDCKADAQYEAVDRMASILERRQRPVCAAHARFLSTQGFWIFPSGDGKATSLTVAEITETEVAK
jgi:hypothetical protein